MDWTDFPWRPGMLTTDDEQGPALRVLRLVEPADVDENGERVFAECVTTDGDSWELVREGDDAVPDLSDPATVGALAGAVREVYGTPTIHARPSMRHGDVIWTMWNGAPLTDRWGNLDIEATSEALAWLAAWNARPR